MALPALPFPIAELGWHKFDEVMKAAGLERAECVHVMKLACGEPPAGFDTGLIHILHDINVMWIAVDRCTKIYEHN